MGLNIVQKLIASHIEAGEPETGQAVALRVSQVLAHDVSGPLVFTQFEQLGVEKILCDLAAFYVDHQIVAHHHEVIERHGYLRNAAARSGSYYSQPGNGMGHYVHLERLGVPGRTLLSAAGYAQTLGALGMLALSADAVEVAAAMAGERYHLIVPPVIRVWLHGRPRPFVSPKDIALELLRRRGINGLTGWAIEVDGPSVRGLGVYERSTIANMGAVLGAITTVFPSDEKTRIFLQRQRRSKSWRKLEVDPTADFQDVEDVDLGAIEPLALCSPAPGTVRPVREVQGRKVQEVLIGSCCNASLRDLLVVAAMIRGKKVHPDCTLSVSPGSRQALEVLARGDSGGALADMISAGIRILESSCGPCETPYCLHPDRASVRTFAHLPTDEAYDQVLVVSPETAVACALRAEVVDPRKHRRPPKIKMSQQLPIDDSMLIKPTQSASDNEVFELADPPKIPEPISFVGDLRAQVIGRLGHGARLDRLDDDELVEVVDDSVNGESPGCFVAGQSLDYGQLATDSALAHRRKGVMVVIAGGFASPCEISLAHAGVVPLRFLDENDYDRVKMGDELVLHALADNLLGEQPISVAVANDGVKFEVICDLDQRTREILISGGLLGFLKKERMLLPTDAL